MTSDKGVVDSNEVLEVMSPQVRVERMGPTMVEDLPRYHSLVQRIDEVADRWRSTGRLMGLANVGDGYVLEVQIPLSGEEGDFVLGQMDRMCHKHAKLLTQIAQVCNEIRNIKVYSSKNHSPLNTSHMNKGPLPSKYEKGEMGYTRSTDNKKHVCCEDLCNSPHNQTRHACHKLAFFMFFSPYFS